MRVLGRWRGGPSRTPEAAAFRERRSRAGERVAGGSGPRAPAAARRYYPVFPGREQQPSTSTAHRARRVGPLVRVSSSRRIHTSIISPKASKQTLQSPPVQLHLGLYKAPSPCLPLSYSMRSSLLVQIASNCCKYPRGITGPPLLSCV